MLVITSALPELWNSWVRFDATGHVALCRIAEQTVELDERWTCPKVSTASGDTSPKRTVDTLQLPTTNHPFTDSDLNELVAVSPTPRIFIERANEAIEQWLEELKVRRLFDEYFIRGHQLHGGVRSVAAADGRAETRVVGK